MPTLTCIGIHIYIYIGTTSIWQPILDGMNCPVKVLSNGKMFSDLNFTNCLLPQCRFICGKQYHFYAMCVCDKPF